MTPAGGHPNTRNPKTPSTVARYHGAVGNQGNPRPIRLKGLFSEGAEVIKLRLSNDTHIRD